MQQYILIKKKQHCFNVILSRYSLFCTSWLIILVKQLLVDCIDTSANERAISENNEISIKWVIYSFEEYDHGKESHLSLSNSLSPRSYIWSREEIIDDDRIETSVIDNVSNKLDKTNILRDIFEDLLSWETLLLHNRSFVDEEIRALNKREINEIYWVALVLLKYNRITTINWRLLESDVDSRSLIDVLIASRTLVIDTLLRSLSCTNVLLRDASEKETGTRTLNKRRTFAEKSRISRSSSLYFRSFILLCIVVFESTAVVNLSVNLLSTLDTLTTDETSELSWSYSSLYFFTRFIVLLSSSKLRYMSCVLL